MQRSAIVASNLLAPLGVLLFGWDAAPAIVLLLLGTLLHNLGIGVMVVAALKGVFGFLPRLPFLAWPWGAKLAAIFIVALFALPAVLASGEIDSLLRQQFPRGAFAAAFAEPLLWAWIVLDVFCRGAQLFARASVIQAQPADAAEWFKSEGAYRCMEMAVRYWMLVFFAWISSWSWLQGRLGLAAFIAGVSALFVAMELFEDRLRRSYNTPPLRKPH